MSEQYLIVNTKILPAFYEKVVAARDLVEQHKVKGVSEAVQRVGISRSTYYKYKDSIFSFSENARGRKAVLSMILTHQQGVLSEVLNELAAQHTSVLTINQSIPIHDHASVSLSLDISDLDCSIDEVLRSLKEKKGVTNVRLIDLE